MASMRGREKELNKSTMLRMLGVFMGLVVIVCFWMSPKPVKQVPLPFRQTYRQPTTKTVTTTPLLSKGALMSSSPGLSRSSTSVSTGNVSLSSLHKKWQVNCTEILHGNETEIKRSVKLLRRTRSDLNLKGDPFMPPDADVRLWTEDCTWFKNARNYPRHSLSNEEAAFPLAYSIVVHKGSAQVEHLLRAIYQPQNIYCIHTDNKSHVDFKNAIRGLADCFDNVFIASRTEVVSYAGYTRLLADINCMRDLVGPRASGYPWRYIINLCGQDFPLKSNLEIVRKLKSYNGHNDIEVIEPKGKRARTKFRFKEESGHLRRTRELKKQPPHGLKVYTGMAYFTATRKFVEYVVKNKTAQDLLEWTNETFSPDETFWATLQHAAGVPGGRYNPPGGYAARFVRWMGRSRNKRCRGRVIRGICVFSMGYVQYLTSVKAIFCNKFDYAFDPIALQCIEEATEYRTQHPEQRAPPPARL